MSTNSNPSDFELEEFCRKWWTYWGPTGKTSSDSLTDSDNEMASIIDNQMDEFTQSRPSLSRLLVALAATAESQEHLAYIGGSVLNEAAEDLGTVFVMAALQDAGLTNKVNEAIVRDYLPPLREGDSI